MKKILVIIPHYNKLILLKECLFHLEKEDYKNFDIMIVDNGSDDGSANYIFELSNKSDKYKYILLNENMGFAYAVNRGLEYSINNGYEYSILLNNDAYIKEDFIRELLYKIRRLKKCFAVSALMINYHKNGIIDSFGDNYSILGWAFQNKIGESVASIDNDEDCFSACAGASIYNNKVFSEIGLFDENFFAYLEDVDISYRAQVNGYKITTCKNAICYHLGSATSGSKYNEFKVRISARNNIYLIYKNMPYILILINIFPLFVGTFIKLLYFISIGYGLDYFFGVFDGFKTLSKIRKNNNYSIGTNIIIELKLILNTIKYLFNFVNRHR